MTTSVPAILRRLRPGGLTGPILYKELRVASRRRRMYVLRTAYLLLMAAVVGLYWLEATKAFSRPNSGGNAWRIEQMSMAGTIIAVTLSWFQFGLVQLVAVVLMSTAISEEIDHATLGTLMTTPITSLQVVAGKLLGRLWHLLVLLTISLPVLALARVLGGVSWEFVVASTCVTVCTAIALGSLSLYFSIFNRRSYVVILKALGVAAVAFALVPILAMAYADSRGSGWNEQEVLYAFGYVNPYIALGGLTIKLMEPRASALVPPWPIVCGALLAYSALLLAFCVVVVRRVALRQATGEAGLFVRRRRRRHAGEQTPAGQAALSAGPARAGRIRPITGSPIVWHELRQGTLRQAGWFTRLGRAVVVLALVVLIGYLHSKTQMNSSEVHMVFIAVLGGLGVLVTAVVAATGITGEKESRAWPIVLSTPLNDWHLLAGKAVGAWRRSLPAWLLPGAYVAIYTSMGYMLPIVPLCLTMSILSVVMVTTATGLYWSVRCRRTTTAVVANVVTILALWLVLPVALAITAGVMEERFAGREPSLRLIAAAAWTNPGVQAMIVSERATGERAGSYRPDAHSPRELIYHWPGRLWSGDRMFAGWSNSQQPRYGSSSETEMTAGQTILMHGACTGLYALLSLLVAQRARRRLRRNIL